MEGHGFLLGVHINHPVQGIVVRGISDCLDEKNPVDDDVWQPRAARHAAAFAFQVLAKFPLVDRPTGLSMDVSVLNPEVASWSLDKTVFATRSTILAASCTSTRQWDISMTSTPEG